MMTLFQNKLPSKIPLRFVLIVPFTAIIVLAVSLLGYIAYINGHKMVDEAARQIHMEISARIEDHLNNFMEVPRQINEFNYTSFQKGWTNPKDEKALQAYFLEQVKNHDTITSVYFGNIDGGIIGSGREGLGGAYYVYATEDLKAGTFKKYIITESGELGKLLPPVPDFDARTRPWYIGAKEKGEFSWNNIYILFTGQDMTISASSPVYDEDNHLLGVISVDIFLSQIEEFLKSLKISKSGQIFIMERSGLLVAASTGEKPFAEKNGKMERLNASDSQSPIVKYSAGFLRGRFGSDYEITDDQQLEFTIDEERYFLTVSPVHQGVDWLTVVVIPESDFTAEIIATNRSTALVTVLALIFAIGFSIFVSQKISDRISYMNKSIRVFAHGEGAGLEISNSRISEIDELATAFVEMQDHLQVTLANLKAEVEERRNVEQTLRESETRFRLLAENSTDMISRHDPQGIYLYVSPACKSILGYEPEEMIGHSAFEFIHPDDAFTVDHARQVIIEQPVNPTTIFRARRKDGEYIWLETISHVVINPETGIAMEVHAASRDITARRQMHKDLRESEQRYKMISELTSDYIYKIGVAADGKVSLDFVTDSFYATTGRDVNQAKTLESWSNIFHPDDLEKVMAFLQTLIATHQPGQMECRTYLANGQMRWVEITARPEWNGKENRVASIIGAVKDITLPKLAEEKIRESEEQLKAVIEGSQLGFSDWNIATNTIRRNERWAGMLGYTLQEIEDNYRQWEDLLHPDDRARAKQALQEHIDGKTPIHRDEYRLRAKDGSYRWILDQGTIVEYDKQGRPLRMTATHTDITERKNAEEALRESEDKFKYLFEYSMVGKSITHIGGEVYVNKALCDMLGYSSEEMQGKKWQAITHPDDIELTQRNIDALAAGEKNSARFIKRFVRKNGDIVWVDLSSSLRRDSHNKPLYLMTAVIDITDRKQAEEALVESENRFRSVLETISLLGVLLDTEGRIILCNNFLLDLTGWKREEVLNQIWFDIFLPPEIHDEIKDGIFSKSIRDGAIPTHYVNEIITRQNERRLVQWNNTVLRDQKGIVIGVASIGEDITARKQAEEEIRKLNAELEQRVWDRTLQLETTSREMEAFSYSVSHDLRAPLRGIDGWSQALREDYYDKLDEQGRQYIDRVRVETQRMGHLIDDMLELAQLTRAEMRKEQMDLSVLAQIIAERLQKDEPSRKVDFIIQPGLTAEGDPYLLEAALTNLLGNAFKFTGKTANARIEFGQTESQGQRVFFIRDNGAGFDMAYSQKLFGAFQRMHKATEFPGTGIGLASVQRVIHRHGGKVWAEAEVDRGATFYFTLG
jgi:PAS domain S-box-containing protein